MPFVTAFTSAILFTALAALPSFAQSRDGADRPSNWRVTHYESFGIWNSICDTRPEDGKHLHRCYIRHVEVFSPRPNFAAQFIFVTPTEDGAMIEFGIEPGTLFDPDGFRIESGETVTWATRHPGCLTGIRCQFQSAEAADLLGALSEGEFLRFSFVDRHGMPRNLSWPLDGFAAAYADFLRQSAARDLT